MMILSINKMELVILILSFHSVQAQIDRSSLPGEKCQGGSYVCVKTPTLAKRIISNISYHYHRAGRTQFLNSLSLSLSLSLAVHPYPSTFLTSPLDGIQRPHPANVWKSLLVGQHLCVHNVAYEFNFLLQECPTNLFSLTWMDWEMGRRWPNRCCFVGCCFQDLF